MSEKVDEPSPVALDPAPSILEPLSTTSAIVSSAADSDATSTVDSLRDCSVKAHCIPLSRDVDAVDKKGNKLDVDGNSSVESEKASNSCTRVLASLTSHSVTLTPLKHFKTVPSTSSPSARLTPSKQQRPSSKPSTPSRSLSPQLKAAKTKSPGKSSTPSKSSPRQRSLTEMFLRSSAATTSDIFTRATSSTPVDPLDQQSNTGLFEGGQKSDSSPREHQKIGVEEVLVEDSQMGRCSPTPVDPLDQQSTTGLFEGGQKSDSSPREHQKIGVEEVLVEDSQMGQCSPVRVVDTQESMFVDDTPPDGKSTDHTAADSSSEEEVLQQTVVHVAADDNDTSVTPSKIPLDAVEVTASGVGEVSSHLDNVESSASGASEALDKDAEVTFRNCRSIHLTGDRVMSARDTNCHIKHSLIDHTQPSQLNNSQTSSLDHTQLDDDGTQHSAVDHTQERQLNSTQHAMADHTQTRSFDHTQLDEDGTQHSTLQGSCSTYTQQVVLEDNEMVAGNDDVVMTTATEDDIVPVINQSSDNDLPLSLLVRSQDDGDDTTKTCPSTTRQEEGPKSSDKSSTDGFHAASSDDDLPLSLLARSQDDGDDTVMTCPSITSTPCPQEGARSSDKNSKDSFHAASSDDDLPLTELVTSGDEVVVNVALSSSHFGRRKRAATIGSSRDAKDAVLRGRVTRRVLETRPTRLNLRTRSVRRLTDKLVSVGAKKVDRIPTEPPVMKHRRGRPRKSDSQEFDAPVTSKTRLPSRIVTRRSCKSVWMRVAEAEVNALETRRDEDSAASASQRRQDDGKVSDDKTDEDAGTGTIVDVVVDSAIDESVGLESDDDGRKQGEVPGPFDDRSKVVTIVDEVPAVEDVTKVVAIMEASVCLEKLQDVCATEESVRLDSDVEPSSDDELMPSDSPGKPDRGTDLCEEVMAIKDSVAEVGVETTGEELSASQPSQSSLTSANIGQDVSVTETTVQINNSAPRTSAEDAVVFDSVPDDDTLVTQSNKRDTEPTVDDVIKDMPVSVTQTHLTDSAPVSDDIDKDGEVSKSHSEVKESTPMSELDADHQWKVPTSSVTRGGPPLTAAVDVLPETPTSVPRRRFTSRGSLMLERAKQLRRSTTSSPPVNQLF